MVVLFATDILARPALVKAHVRVFVNCLVPNPAFDSQSKERLATPEAALGFNVRVTDAFAAAVADAGVEAAVVETLKAKDKAVRVGVCMFVHHWRSSHLFMPVDFAQGHSGCRQKVEVHPEARGCQPRRRRSLCSMHTHPDGRRLGEGAGCCWPVCCRPRPIRRVSVAREAVERAGRGHEDGVGERGNLQPYHHPRP